MHIHCPHCRSPVEVVEDQKLRDVICPSCGSSFNLLPDETVTRIAREQKTLGHFELIDRVGIGAFGEVWTAHDTELDRTVAVKLPRKGQLTAEESESFLREARSAARLNHPGIVAVHEVGKADDQLFIVSDYVRGVTLADWFTSKRPSPKEAAEMVAQLADAVQHAHEHGVIHRDLKPSNVMLDDAGGVRIMDFGLAKREAGEITMTMDGKVLGTPAYMSPEQAKGAAHDADARSDVYSLGVILFELVTGELPFRGNARMLVHQVIHDEPPSPRRFSSQVPLDLDTICLKCLEKEPAKRYDTAHYLADDLRRFLTGATIAARPITRLERSWRWCTRHRAVSAMSALLVFVMVFAAVISTSYAALAAREAARNRQLLYISDMNAAQNALREGNILQVSDLLFAHVPKRGPVDYREFEWFYLWREAYRGSAIRPLQLPYQIFDMSLSDDDRFLAVGLGNATGVVFDLQTRNELFRVGPQQVRGAFISFLFVALSPDARWLAYAHGNSIRLRETRSGNERELVQHSARVCRLQFFPDGERLVWGSQDGTVAVTRIADGVITSNIPRYRDVWDVAVDPSGQYVAAGYGDGKVMVWDCVHSTAQWENDDLHHLGVTSVSFSNDGRWVASASNDRTARVLDAKTGVPVCRPVNHDEDVRMAAFSPDGRWLATASKDNTVRIWELPSGTEVDTLRGHSGGVMCTAFLRHTPLLVSASGDRTVRFWRWGRPSDRSVMSVDTPATSLWFLANGLLCAATEDPRTLEVWDIQTYERRFILELGNAATALSASEDGLLVTAASSGVIQIWDIAKRQVVVTLVGHESGVTALAFSRDGQHIASGDKQGRVKLWKRTSSQAEAEYQLHTDVVQSLAFSSDGTKLASGSLDWTIAVWDLHVPDPYVVKLTGHNAAVLSVAFSPNGESLASSSWDYTIKLWNLRHRELPERTLPGHGKPSGQVSFSTDGRTLFSIGNRTIRLWDVESGQIRQTLREEVEPVSALAISHDETTIASVTEEGTIRLWRAATSQEVEAAGEWWRH